MDISALISDLEPKKDNMLNILHRLQNKNPNNYLTSKDLKFVAEYLNTTYSSVYGVAKYYSMFSLKPRGKNIIRICKSPVCNMIGSKSLIEVVENFLDIKMGGTTSDMLFTLEPSECLGHCAQAPVMMINDKMYTDLNEDKIKGIIEKIINNNLTK
ncbi:MAG: NAD(P)H-dependent oxidoreductase subunit E [Bacteroidota bacterium]|nr:NAD(P)H-dependent oxidoreductase subunit E [Bacteroidota bacterium]